MEREEPLVLEEAEVCIYPAGAESGPGLWSGKFDRISLAAEYATKRTRPSAATPRRHVVDEEHTITFGKVMTVNQPTPAVGDGDVIFALNPTTEYTIKITWRIEEEVSGRWFMRTYRSCTIESDRGESRDVVEFFQETVVKSQYFEQEDGIA